MHEIKVFCATWAGLIGGALSAFFGGVLSPLFGGFDMTLCVLLICMAADYVTGFLVAAVFRRSKKSQDGALSSNAGWRGLCKKGVVLIIVVVAHHAGVVSGISFVREGVIFAFMANEIVSLFENAALMGVPVPPAIPKVIDALKSRAGEKRKEE